VRILARPGTSRALLEGGPFEYATGDVLEPDTLPAAMKGVDVVFHAAGVVDHWRQGLERMRRVNVEGTRNVVEAALQAGVERLVHTSSVAALGIHPDVLVDETFRFNVAPDRFPYGHSKWLAEEEVLSAVGRGLRAVLVSPTTVMGPRDVREVSCGVVVEVADHCAPPLIPPGGTNVVAICDVVQGHIEAALEGRVGERYILGGENLTHLQLYRTIADVVGCGMKLRGMPRWMVSLAAALTDVLHPRSPGSMPLTSERLRLESQTFYFDTAKAREAFRIPFTPLRTTIGRTYEWYQSERAARGGEGDGRARRCGRSAHRHWPEPRASAEVGGA
jgi:dihydroflavonol-4-reductase